MSLETEPAPVYSAVVTEITDRIEETFELSFDYSLTVINIFFDARLSNGEEVSVTQSFSSLFDVGTREVEAGDRILVIHQYGNFYDFMDYERINYIIFLGVVFFIAIVLFGRQKGFNSIVALLFTCTAIFMVFIPSILSGHNIYILTAIISGYSIISTLFIVVGPHKKAVSAMLGCLGGVLFAGIIMYGMDIVMNLTGFVDSESSSLLNLPVEINLRAIIFAGVVIGSTGAIMDVAMSISSSLWEVGQMKEKTSFKDIFKSGMEIGKDILGTMLNTLILAYIGSSISTILLLTAHSTSIIELINMEMIIVEFLRAFVGSFGMFLTVPLTAGICGYLYSKSPSRRDYQRGSW